jgi:threonine dehydratase
MSVLLTTGEILAARTAIDPVFLDSPLMRHPALDAALGCVVTLKGETLNPIRSFKGRGTEAVLDALAPRPAAVVTASTGNFGQGIAWAVRRHDLRTRERESDEGRRHAAARRGGAARRGRS